MPTLSAEQIYRIARAGGFSPDQAVTMTAIALAESGGNIAAHNPVGEDSRGLWQINFEAHADALVGFDFSDPVDQARAAFYVSREGDDISPWTVTHAEKGARYLQHRQAAEAAAVAAGDVGARGQWDPPQGYGDRTPAGAADPDAPPVAVPFVDAAAGNPSLDLAERMDTDGGPSVNDFLAEALGQDGKRYVFGAETSIDDASPNAFDCSELVEWAAKRIGLSDTRDGTVNQYDWLQQKGMLIPVEDAVNIPGALLYSFPRGTNQGGHVAISLGDGTTIEARGRAYGTGQFDVNDRFEFGALLPGLDYGGAREIEPAALHERAEWVNAALASQAAGDADRDLLADPYEARAGLDPNDPDTDGDGITDGYELVVLGTDALNPDSDYDGLSDDIELGLGLDPLVADNPDPDAEGALPLEAWVDSDGDGVVDWYESVLGTDADRIDIDEHGRRLDEDELETLEDVLPSDPGDVPTLNG